MAAARPALSDPQGSARGDSLQGADLREAHSAAPLVRGAHPHRLPGRGGQGSGENREGWSVAKRSREGVCGWWARSARRSVSCERSVVTPTAEAGDKTTCPERDPWPLSPPRSKLSNKELWQQGHTDTPAQGRKARQGRPGLLSGICLQGRASPASDSTYFLQLRTWEAATQLGAPERRMVPWPWLPLPAPSPRPLPPHQVPQGWLARDTREGRSACTRDDGTNSGLRQGTLTLSVPLSTQPAHSKPGGALPVALPTQTAHTPGLTPTQGP